MIPLSILESGGRQAAFLPVLKTSPSFDTGFEMVRFLANLIEYLEHFMDDHGLSIKPTTCLSSGGHYQPHYIQRTRVIPGTHDAVLEIYLNSFVLRFRKDAKNESSKFGSVFHNLGS